MANFENYTGAAYSTIDLKYRRLDVLLAEPVKWLGADMNFLYGVEYAYLNVDETDSYTRAAVAGASSSGSKFSGVGPQVGVSLSYRPFAGPIQAMNGLSVDAAASASLLLASTKGYIRDKFNGTNIGSVNTDSTTRIIPALHARLGLAYAYGWDHFTATLKAGYEFNTYINGLMRTNNPDDVADGQYLHDFANFDLSGLYVTLALKAPL